MRLIRRLSVDEKSELLSLLEAEVQPRLVRQEGRGYASGRLYAWLGWQPELGQIPRATACPRGELWEVLRRYVPGFELAECFLNSANGASSEGIRPHKDHTYAARTAWVVNLGPTRFRIWMPLDEKPSAPGFEVVKENKTNTEFAAELTGDEVLEFNCKLMHASATGADSRWGIGLWTFNPSWKEAARIAVGERQE